MSVKKYPAGSMEDLIINTLPKIVSGFKQFIEVSQGFLRDYQLDLELISTGTADSSQMIEELQRKMKDLQKEMLHAAKMAESFQETINEMKKRLEAK
jgi:methyl-accepting chemotaxis protein